MDGQPNISELDFLNNHLLDYVKSGTMYIVVITSDDSIPFRVDNGGIITALGPNGDELTKYRVLFERVE